ncbi:MAG: glycoside hydrolase [Ruminococcus sp.]|nr:glycoside hydrolase [Ruminococcus sp.]
MKIKSLLSIAAAAAVMMTAVPYGNTSVSATNTSMRDMTTMEIVTDMGIGINLGNTFESCGDWIDQWGDGTPNAYETAWGSPTVTKDMIQGYADAGFGVLRIPVAWSNMMAKDGSYKIHPDYLARVTQVVDWALEADLYVIINLHWDGGWLENLPTNYDECMKKYKTIWTQVSDAFSEYGDYLMFESQNEELGWSSVWNQWGGTSGKEESYGYANAVNQAFVDVVRSSGGNNDERHLLISGYNTDITLTCDPLFKMPDDPAGRCALSVHYYTPAGFAILTQDESWGKASSTWGTDADYNELNYYMDMLDARYSSQGIPVIIGEYGCPKENKEEESVRRYLTSVCEAALSRGGICPVLWDVTDSHYDRSKYWMTDSQLHSQLLAIRDKYLPQAIHGDVNEDGTFSAADAVMLQKYLIGSSTLTNWKNADFCRDGQIDVFDLSVMKKELLKFRA